MVDIIEDIRKYVELKKPFVLARVISTWGSAPRTPGSGMIITEDHEVAGSVSGGCIEGAVIREADEVFKTGEPKELSFGVSDEDAWSVGLTCGGEISVFMEKFPAFEEEERDTWSMMDELLGKDEEFVWITRMDLSGKRHAILKDGVIENEFSDELNLSIKNFLQNTKKGILEVGDKRFFIHSFPKKEKLLIVGAAHISLDLVRLGNMFNFQTILVDPRSIFTRQSRFKVSPDFIYNDWPEEIFPKLDLGSRTFAILLTHDPKIDDQALKYLLNSEVPYIGALGSRKTHAKRVKRLEEAGFDKSQIERITGPAGLDISAKEPSEIALSIMAQVIEVKNKIS